MRDDYGRLIEAEEAPLGALREGGDDIGGRALAVVPTKTVALFSGLVTARRRRPCDDLARHSRFQRRAAADGGGAWRANKLGQCEAHLIVRDPVVGDVRCRASSRPAITRRLALDLDNVEARAGAYHRRRSRPRGAVAFGAAATRDIRPGRRPARARAVALDGLETGIGTDHTASLRPRRLQGRTATGRSRCARRNRRARARRIRCSAPGEVHQPRTAHSSPTSSPAPASDGPVSQRHAL